MKKKILTVMLAGVMVAGMSAGSVQAATTEDASGDLYVFIAASLANAMDEIQKDLMKSIRMLIFFSMQTVQVHYRHRSKKVPDVISSFQQQPNRWMRW